MPFEVFFLRFQFLFIHFQCNYFSFLYLGDFIQSLWHKCNPIIIPHCITLAVTSCLYTHEHICVFFLFLFCFFIYICGTNCKTSLWLYNSISECLLHMQIQTHAQSVTLLNEFIDKSDWWYISLLIQWYKLKPSWWWAPNYFYAPEGGLCEFSKFHYRVDVCHCFVFTTKYMWVPI